MVQTTVPQIFVVFAFVCDFFNDVNIQLMRYAPIIALLFLFNVYRTAAQPFQIRGKVTDVATGKGVPTAHIFPYNDQQNGTISNEDGLFILNLRKPVDTLIISHVSYKICYLPTQKNQTIYRIALLPIVHELSEVIVKPVTAREIVERAINRISDNHKVHPVYYGFYTRIITYSKDSILHFFEEHTGDLYIKKGFFANYSKIRLEKSRFRYLTDIGKKQFDNQYLVSMTAMIWDDLYRNTNDYLNPYQNMDYKFSFLPSAQIMNRPCYVIAFETDRKTYYQSGILYIDKESYAIARQTVGNNEGSITVTTYKPVGEKWYLKSTRDLQAGRFINEQRTTLYNILDQPESTEGFVKAEELLPIKVEQMIDDFNDNYWNTRNVVPLPNWLKKALKGQQQSKGH